MTLRRYTRADEEALRREIAMPGEFEVLARYNAERARGIVHTPEWDERMASLQAKFDEWVRRAPDRSARPRRRRFRQLCRQFLGEPSRHLLDGDLTGSDGGLHVSGQ